MKGFFKLLEDSMEGFLADFGFFGQALLSLVKIILIVITAKLSARFLRWLVRRSFERYAKKKGDGDIARKADTLSQLIRGVIKCAVYFAAVLFILDEIGLGASVSSLLTTAGIGGLAIGFGAQSLISDVTNGFFLMLENQYAVGDLIRIEAGTGKVKKITLRTTQLELGTKELLTVPNGQIKLVTNFSKQDCLALFDAQVAPEADVEKVIALAAAAAEEYAKEHDNIRGPVVSMGVVKSQPGVLTIRTGMLVAPTTQFGTVNDMNKRIAKLLKENDIPLPADNKNLIINSGD